ncbi:MAG: ABC transporter ATP-binding protein [Paracoccaceae bacterium]
MGWCLSGAWPVLGLAAGASALAGSTEVVMAALLGLVIDAALAAGPGAGWPGDGWLLIGALAFFLALRPLAFGLAAAMNAIAVQPQIAPLVLARLHRWTMGQQVGFFDDDFAGRIAQKQMQTARAVTDVASEVINVVAFGLAGLLGSLILLGGIDGRVGVLLALWFAAYVALITSFIPRVRARSKARAGARAELSGQVVDTITNVRTVKLFANAEHEDRAALDAMERFRQASLGFGTVSAAFRVCLMTLAGTLPVLIVGGTLWLWGQGEATAGQIAAAGAVSLRLAQMTGWISFALMALYGNVGEVEDGMTTLARVSRIEDAPGARPLRVTAGAIELRGVTFTYGGGPGGLRDVTLTVPGGQRLGLVGASGAGKSTLAALLLRLHEPEAGTIRIDGQDIATVTQDSLRRAIATVTQDTALFNRSTAENIRYGDPGADEAALEAATERAQALSFVRALRDGRGRTGFDAHLGERGVKLSGGQRQRIALARALLKDAPILILDEATSALDSGVEAAIQEALETAMEGRTVLAIAHRLSTLRAMDRIVVIEGGRVVEDGTHDALLSRGGAYARLWRLQQAGVADAPGEAAE